MGTGLAPWGVQSGPCPVCGLPECRTDHRPFGAPVEGVGRTWQVQANVYRDDRLLYAVGELIPWEDAVAEGLTTDSDLPADPPKGKRTGQRARRPAENRVRPKGDDR